MNDRCQVMTLAMWANNKMLPGVCIHVAHLGTETASINTN